MNSYSVAERINSDVNASVKYKTDLEQYDTPEIWREAGSFGDCEDYALLKLLIFNKINKLCFYRCVIHL